MKGERICKECNQPFIPNSNRQSYCKRPHYRTCPICQSKYLEDNNDNLKNPPVACSYECRALKSRKTNINKYGIPAAGNTPEARKKSISTSIKNNGTPYALQSEKIKSKSKDTWIKNYGVDNPSKSNIIIEKRRKTCLRKYGTTSNLNSPEGIAKIEATMIERYGKRTPGRRISKQNTEIRDIIRASGLKAETEFNIKSMWYDIYVPDNNILIEINPSYTHSVLSNHFGQGKDIAYHQTKSKIATDAGYRCIHIWDWDNVDIIVRNLLTPKMLSIQDTDIQIIDSRIAREFINKYNYTPSISAKLYIGTLYLGKLISVMSLTTDVKYCAKVIQYVRIPEIDSYNNIYRLLEFAIYTYELDNIACVIDLSKDTGKVLDEIGFSNIGEINPTLFWSKGTEYRKDQKYSTGYTDKMINDGWLPVYNAGYELWVGAE